MQLRDLITELCPYGVPFEPLSAIGEWYGGGTPSKGRPEYWVDGTIPWVSPKDMGRRIVDVTRDYITESAVKSSATRLVPPYAVAMVVRSSILDRVLPTALIPVSVALNQDMKAVVPRPGVLPGYVAHVLASNGQAILRTARRTGGSVASLETSRLMGFKIPVPPTEVQREIVRILDYFTDLEAVLEAELEARTRQYSHYRDFLMQFEPNSIESATLGKLTRIVRGASPRPIQAFLTSDPSGVPWIKIGDVAAGSKFITVTAERVTEQGASKSRRVYPGDFVLSNSMSFGRPYISQIEGCVHDGWLVISHFSDYFLPDFLYHLLRSSTVQREFARRAGSGTVQNLNADIVRSVVVPVPALEEQRRIVEILDRFDALVNDMSVGLPAELTARRRQYEYYRDKLLTFPEAAA